MALKTKRPKKTPMTEFDRQAARGLWKRVTFLPASYDKRFCCDLAILAEIDTAVLTDNQRRCLHEKVVRYRKSLPAWMVEKSQQFLAKAK